MKYSRALVASFWGKVEKSSGKKCRRWLGVINPASGYGQTRMIGRKTLRAHRVAFQLFYGPIPDGLDVLHSCDNRECCNPSHFFLGTNGDNNRDRSKKGRSAVGLRHGRITMPERTPRGESHALSKLNDGLVKTIRSSMLSSSAMADRVGVSRTTIKDVRSRKTWKHIQ